MISIEDFSKIELRVARILSAERVEGSEKLVKLEVDAGDIDEAGGALHRQVLAGIAKAYDPEALLNKTIVIVANLEPRKLMGMESNGMLLAATDPSTGVLALLTPDGDVAPGSKIR